MKKLIAFTIVVIVLGVGYWLVSPFFINKQVSEESPLVEQVREAVEESENAMIDNFPKKIASGSFVGFDKIHYGSGNASLIQTQAGYIIRFEEDFNVANGPDLYVGLGSDGEYKKGSEIAKLKGNIGSQNYTLPEDFDIDATNEIWIWCKAFSVPFAKVVLLE